MSLTLLFIFVNFVVAACSDLGLNYMSTKAYAPQSIQALKPYFKEYEAGLAAVLAGITVVSVLVVTMILSKFLLGFAVPRCPGQLWKFVALAFPLGFLADVIIHKMDWFGPSLRPFYKAAGAGLSGAFAFIFAILISYAMLGWAGLTFQVYEGIALFNTGRILGEVGFTQTDKGVDIVLDLKGLKPNQKHGFHIHEKGDSRDECKKACAHYNPTGTTHGGLHNGHAGDLGNISATKQGTSNHVLHTNKFALDEIIGRSLIIHADEDDLGKGSEADSLTTGHSGARIACVVIGRC